MNIENLGTQSGILQSGNTEVLIPFTVGQQTNVEIDGFSNSLSLSNEGVRFRLGNDSNNDGDIDDNEVVGGPSTLPLGGITNPLLTFEGDLDAGDYLIELTPQANVITNPAFQVEYNLDINSTPLDSTDTDNDGDMEADSDSDLDLGEDNSDTSTDGEMDTENSDSDLDVSGDDSSANPSGFETIDLIDSGDQSIEFTVTREAGFNNTVDFYPVDADGNVTDPDTGDAIVPGEAGYLDAAIANRLGADIRTDNGVTSQFSVEFSGGVFYAPLLAVNSDFSAFSDSDDSNDPVVYFTYEDANVDGFDHVIGTETQLTFEDLPNGGDEDFNDIVLDFELATNEPIEEEEPVTEEPVDETPIEESVDEIPMEEESEGNSSISGLKFNDINASTIRDTNTSLVQENSSNIVFVVDTSPSVFALLPGADVGDVNRDGMPNQVIDVELQGLINLNEQLDDNVNVEIVAFEGEAVSFNDTNDTNVEEILRSLDQNTVSTSGTNYNEALLEAEEVLGEDPEPGNLVFLSDGEGFLTDENNLQYFEENEINISAFEVREERLPSLESGEVESLSLRTIDQDAQVLFTNDANDATTIINTLTDFADVEEEVNTQSTLEEVVPGITIYLDLNNNGELDEDEPSQVTDENGEYIFEGLAAGTYTVREVIPDGFTSTTGETTITLGEGDAIEGVDFGNISDEELALLNVEPDM